MKEKFRSMSQMLLAVAAFVIVFSLGGDAAKASSVTQSAQTTDSITVSWTNPTSSYTYSSRYQVKNYYVGYGTDSKTAQAMMDAQSITLGADQTSYTISGLQAGSRYDVYVKCVYTYNGGKQYDTRMSGTVKTLPGKVTNLNQERWYRWALTCYVQWDRQDACDGYEYVWYNHKGKVLDQSTTTGTGFSEKVKNYNTYTAKVRAYSTINNVVYYGDWSDEAFFFTQPSKSNKDAVVNAKVSGSKMKISWKKMNGVSGYNVYVSTNPHSGYSKVASVKSNKSAVTIKKLKKKAFKSNKTYYVYVQAYKTKNGITYTTGVNYITQVKKKRVSFLYAQTTGTYE